MTENETPQNPIDSENNAIQPEQLDSQESPYAEGTRWVVENAGHFNANQLKGHLKTYLIDPLLADASRGDLVEVSRDEATRISSEKLLSPDAVIGQIAFALNGQKLGLSAEEWAPQLSEVHNLRGLVSDILADRRLISPMTTLIAETQVALEERRQVNAARSLIGESHQTPEVNNDELHIEAAQDLGEKGTKELVEPPETEEGTLYVPESMVLRNELDEIESLIPDSDPNAKEARTALWWYSSAITDAEVASQLSKIPQKYRSLGIHNHYKKVYDKYIAARNKEKESLQ